MYDDNPMDERYEDDLNDWETDQVYKDRILEDLESYKELDRDYGAERNAVVATYDPSEQANDWDYDVLSCEFCGVGIDPEDGTDVVTPEGHLVACKACIAGGVQDRVRGPIGGTE